MGGALHSSFLGLRAPSLARFAKKMAMKYLNNSFYLVKGNWKALAVFLLLVTATARIWLVNENRIQARELQELRTQQVGLLEERELLVLEIGVLQRPTRLQDYATKKLGMSKPSKVYSIYSAQK